MVSSLIKAGIDPNVPDELGRIPLECTEDDEIIEILKQGTPTVGRS